MKRVLRKIVDVLLPSGSRGRRVLKELLIKLNLKSRVGSDNQYHEWIEHVEAQLRDNYPEFSYRPLISVVVPCYNTEESIFREMVYSVVNQFYDNWELVLVNASTNDKDRERIKEISEVDTRIKVYNFDNKGISGNTNLGIKKSQGEFVSLLDHDDLLTPNALSEVVAALNNDNTLDLIYSDEDKVSEDTSAFSHPHFKPDFSPGLLTNVNYITHFSTIRKTVLHAVGLLDPKKDGAQDFDLFLKVTDHTKNIYHIPKILYHWRTIAGSTGADFSNKPNITNSAVAALDEHLKRTKASGSASTIVGKPGFYEVAYQPPKSTKVSIILSDISDKNLIDKTIKGLLDITDFPHYEILTKSTLPTITDKRLKTGVKSIKQEMNGSVMVFIGCSAVPKDAQWLTKLAGVVTQTKTDYVAPIVLDAHTRILDAGYVADGTGGMIPLFQGFVKGVNTYFGNTDWVRNVDSLSGQFFVVKASTFLSSKQSLPAFTRSVQALPSDQNVVIWTHVEAEMIGSDAITNNDVAATRFFSKNLRVAKSEFGMMPNSKLVHYYEKREG